MAIEVIHVISNGNSDMIQLAPVCLPPVILLQQTYMNEMHLH